MMFQALPSLPEACRKGRVLYMESFRRAVSDLDRAVDFYCDALGFELDLVDREPQGERRAVLALGDEALELIARDRRQTAARPPHEAPSTSSAFQHIAIVARDMPAAFARLMRFSPSAISQGGPVMLPPSTGSVTAFKFRDPDGHPLELIHFPKGTGDPRWQRSGAEHPTVGIDHSAIVVNDAARSIAFYADLLGFSVASRQVNQGQAQARLDGAPDVVVDVVALDPAEARTPHLELLCYQQPSSDGGLDPSSLHTTDHIVWAVSDLADLLARLNATGSQRPVPGIVDNRALILDPDGHGHRLVES